MLLGTAVICMLRHKSMDTPLSPRKAPVANEEPEVKATSPSWTQGWTLMSVIKVLAILVAFVALLCIGKIFLYPMLLKFLDASKEDPQGTVFLFMVVTVVAVLLLCPGPVMAVAAGAAYGYGLGCVVCYISVVAAQALAYMLGRMFLKDMLSNYLRKNVKVFPAIETAVARVGWKLVFALRMSPVLPDSFLNYVFSVTPLTFVPYILASAATQVVYTLVYVYVGVLSNAAISGGDENENMTVKWLSYAFTGVLVVVSSWFIIRFANGIVKDALAEAEASKGGAGTKGEKAS